MSCPHCGFEDASGVECARCGVILARARTVEKERAHAAAHAARRSERPGRPTWLIVTALVAASAVAGFALWRSNARKASAAAPEPEDAPALASPITPPPLPPTSEIERSMERAAAPKASEASPSSTVLPVPAPDGGATPFAARATTAAGRSDPVVCAAFDAQLPELPAERKPARFAAWESGADGYARAVDAQNRSGAPLLLYFYTDWCGWCRRYAREVLDRPESDEALEAVARVRVNPERGAEERRLAQRFGVRGYPTLLAISEPGAAPQKLAAFEDRHAVSAEVLAARVGARRISAAAAEGAVREGYHRLERGDRAGALTAFARAVRMAPRHAPAHYWRGVAHARFGAKARAVLDLRIATALDGGDVKATLQLATLALDAGCVDPARASLRRACELGSGSACRLGAAITR